jgi:A/G-specific adenine glycosylase
LRWYKDHRRDLPWRRTHDPYKVLVSEVMLQQTQVERVIPKYREFVERFPTLQALAGARLADVLRTWVGLGYNGRARRLWECARTVCDRSKGRLPSRQDALAELPGLGRYGAAAVACFAFGARVPVVETNVKRVLGRALLGQNEITLKDAWRLAESALPRDASAWSQALMDIGALFCRATPRCESCPARNACAYAASPPRNPVSRGAGSLDPADPACVARPSGRANPSSQRSLGTLHPAAKGRFEGSRRQHRGRIVRSLARVQSLSLMRLGPQVKADYCETDLPWLRDLLRGLARDGLVVLDAKETRARLP